MWNEPFREFNGGRLPKGLVFMTAASSTFFSSTGHACIAGRKRWISRVPRIFRYSARRIERAGVWISEIE